MPRIIEKIIVKDGCEKECGNQTCTFNEIFNSKDITEVVFKGTFGECKAEAKRLFDGTDRIMQHCYYSGGQKYEHEYTTKEGYLVKGSRDESALCFIAKANTDAFMSYEVTEQTTEEIIEKDRKTFRSGMLSRVIRKSSRQTELNLRIKTRETR